jgi:DNA mismatch endonuclease (patch repair protein)
MSQIKGKNTKPEILVRKFLFSKGFRFRIHVKNLPGKPDIVLPRYKIAIFVHGCFWHGHKGCKYFVVPKTRTDWWLDKISTNKKKDKENYYKLIDSGWKILTVFECELKAGKREKTLNELISNIY